MDTKQRTQSRTPVKRAAIQPKIQYRENMEVDHHLFKSTIASCLKGDKYGPVKVKSIEHVHFFHTVNSNGQAQQYTSPVAGHVHAVEWGVDAEGNLVAKCGPPLKKVARVKNGLTRTSYEPIKVVNFEAAEGEPDIIPDNHQHKMVYLGSDRLSRAKVDSIKKANKEEIGEIGAGAVKTFTSPGPVEGFDMKAVNPGTRKQAREEAEEFEGDDE